MVNAQSDWSYRDCQRNPLGAKVLHKALRVAGPRRSLCLFGQVFRRGYPAKRAVPSHPEVSYTEPARARQHPGKCERSTCLEEQRGGPEGGRPASHIFPPPLNLQLAWSVGGTRPCSVQSEKLVRCLFRFQNTWKR